MNEETTIKRALAILYRRIASGDALSSPNAVRDYLRLTLSGKEHEVFVVILLDAHNRVLSADFAHNHPSGVAEPSHADEVLTQNLKQALALVDVKTLDHFVVAGGNALSFAERGLI